MKKYSFVLLACIQLFITGCSVKPLITNQYKLGSFSKRQIAQTPTSHSIFVNTPDAVAGYQGEEMLYTNKAYEVMPFVHNAWVDQPAEMLLPLIVQSLQRSGYFRVVASSPSSDLTEYRIDTQLIELQQSFITKPSTINFVVKVVLTHIEDSRVIASRIYSHQVPCPADTPYGGVIAANRATELFTAELTEFIIRRINHN